MCTGGAERPFLQDRHSSAALELTDAQDRCDERQRILTERLARLPVNLYIGVMRKKSDTPQTLEQAVTELLLVTGQLTRRLRAESNARELTWSQLAIMARMDATGPMTTADLARAESVKPQSMGDTLAYMEKEGLVERRPHPTDGRQVLFALTAEGTEARRKVRIAKQEWLLAAMAKLDPAEQQTLISAIQLIRRLGNS
jgi:DNA-binding MarR family transcriptional regulator